MTGAKTGSLLAAAAAVAALVVAGSTTAGAAPSGPPSQPVTVTNSAAQPVPVVVGNLPATQAVSGSVSVSNLPATQPVSGTVAVSNLPATQPVSGTVAVSNLPAAPEVFQLEADGRLDTQFPSVAFQVPAGKQLTIDYLSVNVSAYGGTINPSASISGTYKGQFIRFFEHLDSAPANFGTSYGTQHEVRMTFDPGTTVSLSVTRTGGTQDGLLFLNVHGELLPV